MSISIQNASYSNHIHPNPFPLIPLEVSKFMFAFLSDSSLLNSCLVCRVWCDFANNLFFEQNQHLLHDAFGKAKWAQYYGDVGEEPPLPSYICKILKGPCRLVFWRNNKPLNNKKLHETHILTLIPNSVNGKPYNLDLLGELIQNPKDGHPARYSEMSDLGEYVDVSPAKSYWIFITRKPVRPSWIRGMVTDSEQNYCICCNKPDYV